MSIHVYIKLYNTLEYFIILLRPSLSHPYVQSRPTVLPAILELHKEYVVFLAACITYALNIYMYKQNYQTPDDLWVIGQNVWRMYDE